MLGIVFIFTISIILPIGGSFYALKKHRIKVFTVGCLAFLASQVMLRLPLMNWIASHSLTYNQLQMTQPITFWLIIGLSAGIFEELARYFLMKTVLKHDLSWRSGFLFGLGHGGIEAFLLVGLPVLLNLLSSNVTIGDQNDLLVGGVERAFAILLHIGLSILVMRGVSLRRIRNLGIAILIHGTVNASIGIVPLFVPNSLPVVEGVLIVSSLLLFAYDLVIRKRWEK